MRLAIASRRCPHFLGFGGRFGLSVAFGVVLGVVVVVEVEVVVLVVDDVVLVVAGVGRASENTIGLKGVVDGGVDVGLGIEVVMSNTNSASGSNGCS